MLAREDKINSTLDLRNTPLAPSDLGKIYKKVSDNKYIGKVLWGSFIGDCTELCERIENQITKNNLSFEYFPSDYIHALLSSESYNDINQEGKFLERADITDWQVKKIFNDTTNSGYYSSLYVNDKKCQIVLAHKGTKPNVGDIKADIEGILFGGVIAQQVRAYEATQEAVNLARQLGYNLSITGHSLGAWLAEISVYYCHWSFEYTKVKGVTFDSPGSAPMLESFKPHIRSKDSEIDFLKLDITTYLSAPNPVNSCNEHVGQVYRIFPKLKIEGWFGKAQPIQMLQGHSLDLMINHFDKSTGKPKEYVRVLDWPVLEHGKSEEQKEDKNTVKSIKSWLRDNVAKLSNLQNLAKQGAQHLVREGLDKAPLVFWLLPAGAKSTISNAAVEGGIKLGQVLLSKYTPIMSIARVVNAYLADEIQDKALWGVFKYLDDEAGYREKVNLNTEEKFYLSYQSHYKCKEVLNKEDVLGCGVDEYLERFRMYDKELLEGINLSSLAKKHIEVLIATYSIDYVNIELSEKIIRSQEITIEKLRYQAKRFVELYVEELRPALEKVEFYKESNRLGIATNLVMPRDAYFNGRNKELESIEAGFAKKNIMLITGFNGIGKSMLASKYAYLQADNHKDVRWFQASCIGSLHAGYRKLANELGVDTRGQSVEKVKNLIHQKMTNAREVLFIFDDVKEYADIEFYLQGIPPNIKLLITSKYSRLNEVSDNWGRVELQLFNAKEALDYTKAVLPDLQDYEVEKLLEKIDYLPCRLSKTLSFLKENPLVSIDEYLQSYEEAVNKKDHLEPEFKITLDDVKKTNPLAWEVLQYMAWLDGDFIPVEFIKSLGYEQNQLREAIKSLEKLSLANFCSQGTAQRGIRMHSLLQKDIRLISEIAIDKLANKLGKVLNQLLPSITASSSPIAQIDSYITNANAIIDIIKKYAETEALLLLNKMGRYYEFIQKNFENSISYYQAELTIAQQIEDQENISDILTRIGILYCKVGREREGLERLHQALAIYQSENIVPYPSHKISKLEASIKEYNDYHKDSLEAARCNNSRLGAENYSAIKKVTYNEGAYFTYKKLYGSNHFYTAEALSRVVRAYQDIGYLAKAERYSEIAKSHVSAVAFRAPSLAMVQVLDNLLKKDVINNIISAAEKGCWSDKRFFIEYGAKGYIDTDYLGKQLEENSTEKVELAQMLCFEALNIGILRGELKQISMAGQFAKMHPMLITEIAHNYRQFFVHPDIFKSLSTYLNSEAKISNINDIEYNFDNGETIMEAKQSDTSIADTSIAIQSSLKKIGTSAKEVSLKNKNIGDAGLKVLLDYLNTNKVLDTLDVSGNSITAHGISKLLAKLITTNIDTLEHLSLNKNLVEYGGATKIAELMIVGKKLKSLHVEEANLRDNGVIEIARAMHEGGKQLESLKLRNNNIGLLGTKALARELYEADTLLRLELSNNKLGDEGISYLSWGLENNSKLERLYLSNTGMTDTGSEYLSWALERNKAVTKLSLAENMIGDDGAFALADMLKVNTSLKSLDLYGNKISDKGALALKQVIESHNKTITEINLERNQVSDDLYKAIKDLVIKNHEESTKFMASWVERLDNENKIENMEVKM